MSASALGARYILHQLVQPAPVLLADLPEEFGLYALWDHAGEIRYIGCTPKATEGFRTRIFNKHATGSEGRSHKFTQAYCTGRMWRYCKKLHPSEALSEQQAFDANAAKKLRNAFIRKFCRATYVSLATKRSIGYFSWLTGLESEVQALAPTSMRAWEGIKFHSAQEPEELVEQLLIEVPEIRGAVDRQNMIYQKYVAQDGSRG
jgi:hypothetical protein